MKFLSTRPTLFVIVIRDNERGDFWQLIQILLTISFWFWQHRTLFNDAARVVVAIGDIVNAMLDASGTMYELWTWMWQPAWPGMVGIG